MAKYRLKRFSLSEGGYTGKKVTAKQTYLGQSGILGGLGAAIGGAAKGGKGAIIGLASGAILGAITAALTRSKFNEKPKQNITTKNLFVDFSKLFDEIDEINKSNSQLYSLESFDIDSNLNNYDLQVKSNEDSVVLFFRELNKSEEQSVSDILDDYCHFKKYNDYTAERTKDGNWIVTAKLVSYREASNLLMELMSECRFRINFLTR